MKYVTILNGQRFDIEIRADGSLVVNGETRTVDFLGISPSLYSMLMDEHAYEVVIDEHDGEVEVLLRGRKYSGEVLDERAQLLASGWGGVEVGTGELQIKSPMPGLIIGVLVAEGQQVAQGETLFVLESMKMQNELKAPRDGVVNRVWVQPGQSVEQGKPLLALG
ncbi:MAG: biotin/lipoyl-containing protein [Anaerolineae bacterium]